jgi:Ca2+-binding RTX toxin-like protein
MSSITKNTALTLDGTSSFYIGGDLHTWYDDGFMVGVDMSGTLPSPTATVTLTSGDWSISTLRFVNTVKAVIVDKTTGDGAYFNHIRFGGAGADATFVRSAAGYIEGSDAVEKITLGSGGFESMDLRGGTDVVKAGSGSVDFVNLGEGKNILTASNGWVGAVVGYDGNDTFVGGSGDVGSINLGGGTNNIKIGSGWTGSIITYEGADSVTTTTGNVNYLGVGGGNDIVTMGTGGIDHVALGSGNDRITLNSLSDKVAMMVITADSGTDTVSFAPFLSKVVVDLNTSLPTYTSGGAFALFGFENVIGSGGSDTLSGNSAANTIVGGAGNDALNGQGSKDILTGGAGADTFIFNTALSATTNVDNITDFSAPSDTIRLENAIFTKIVAAGALTSAQFYKSTTGVAHDKDDRIIYESDTGKLFYDADGNGAGASVQFATLSTGLALTSADFYII